MECYLGFTDKCETCKSCATGRGGLSPVAVHKEEFRCVACDVVLEVSRMPSPPVCHRCNTIMRRGSNESI